MLTSMKKRLRTNNSSEVNLECQTNSVSNSNIINSTRNKTPVSSTRALKAISQTGRHNLLNCISFYGWATWSHSFWEGIAQSRALQRTV